MRKRFAIIVRVLLALALVASLVAVTAAPVSAQTAVAAVGFTASPTSAGAVAQYVVGFTTSATGALTANVDTIIVQFPAAVTLPATIKKEYVAVGTTLPTVDPVVIANTIILITPITVAASTAATVIFAQVAGIENPDFAAVANFYVGYVNTSQDTTPVASTTYSAITTYVTFTPLLGPVGTAITVKGVGFAPSKSVDITDAGSVVIGIGTTTGTGTFDVTAYAATTSTGALTATDGDGNTHTTTATFTVVPAPVSVMLGATSGYPGQAITAIGNGWAPGAVISVTLAGNPVTTVPATLIVGVGSDPYPWPAGTFVGSIVVPIVPGGAYTGVNGLRFTDGASVVYYDFTVAPASVTLSPTSGYPGQGITAIGNGWAPGAVISITLAGNPVTTSPATIYVGLGPGSIYPWTLGTWMAAILVPTIPSGAYTGTNGLRFTDGANVVYMDFTVTPAPATIYVPDHYPSIQAAVDAASPGDTIIVRDGTYTENVDVNKDHLNIQSENGAEGTIVQAANSVDHVLEVNADYATISGFTVEGATGIARAGIYLGCDGEYHTISNNICSDNYHGIVVGGTNHNTISENNCSSNFGNGILLGTSDHNTLASNTLDSNGCGILLLGSSSNTIRSNHISNNWHGIYLDGVSIDSSWEFSSNDNVIYQNNFMHNTDSVHSLNFINIWNSPEQITYTYNSNTYTNYLGNYWSDYFGGDSNGNGIGDSPYVIDGDNDNYPLMEPFENYQLLYIPSQVNVLMNDGSVIKMDLDEYVKGVVAAEMSSSWPLEALKAQAIAARTFAVKNTQHDHTLIDVCTKIEPYVHCQAWVPPPYGANIEAAVTSTHNQVITYDDKIISQTLFFGHCNGHTRNSEDYDGWNYYPYLRSVACDCGWTHYYGHGVGMCQYGAKAMAEQGVDYINTLKHYYTGVEIATAYDTDTSISAHLGSPGELRIHDSQGRVTGLVNGEMQSEIPDSECFNNTIKIWNPSDSYLYEVVGTAIGSYDLIIRFDENGTENTFDAFEIPTSPDFVHQYSIDWLAISQGEEGVTLQIDEDGDGVFEETVISDGELTQDEFILQTETVVNFDPDVLYLESKGRWVTAYIELPEGWNVADIDLSTVLLNDTVLAEFDSKYSFVSDPNEYITDHDEDGILERVFKFDRSEVQQILDLGEEVEITITGEVGEVVFVGSDTIRVIGE